MKNVISLLGWIVLVTVIGFYLYGVYLGIVDPQRFVEEKTKVVSYKIAEPLEFLVISMSTGMMINLTALLGIPVLSAVGIITPKASFNGIPEVMSFRKQLQTFCGVIYVVVLIVCFWAWVDSYYPMKNTTVVLPLAGFVITQAKALIAVAVGFIAFVISRLPAQ